VKLDYEVLIPSRKRSNRLEGWRTLFPFAKLFVHHSEHDDYAKIVGDKNVRTHNVKGLWAIHQAMIDTSEREIVVTIDDDVRRVRFISGDGAAYLKIIDAGHVKTIIENTAIVAKDLGLELFGWDLQGKPQYFRPTEPFKIMTPCDTAFGTIGRNIKWDIRFVAAGQFDYNMQVLARSRILWLDSRYYFDNGMVGKGKGGMQGIRTAENENNDTEFLALKWGRHIFRGSSKVKGKMGGMGYRIIVDRKNPMASTR